MLNCYVPTDVKFKPELERELCELWSFSLYDFTFKLLRRVGLALSFKSFFASFRGLDLFGWERVLLWDEVILLSSFLALLFGNARLDFRAGDCFIDISGSLLESSELLTRRRLLSDDGLKMKNQNNKYCLNIYLFHFIYLFIFLWKENRLKT